MDSVNINPEQWVDAHGAYLYNYAFAQVRDGQAAEDLVQETFLAALRARENFRGSSSVRTWLTGILKHKIIDHSGSGTGSNRMTPHHSRSRPRGCS